MAEMLYPTTEGEGVHRHSSIEQFNKYLAVWTKGGWTPIVFDQLDGIVCDEIHTHPVVISFEPRPIKYVFPDIHCTFFSDKFITVDKYGVEERLLPEAFGGDGETYEHFVNQRAFLNYSNDCSLGVHNKRHLRVGSSIVLADETLPAVE